jgi:predicted ATPase/class 3 adenylate cyclase
MNLPSGTVSFLFTDIEGSTRLWEEHPEWMQPALAEHDALLATTIRKHQGHVFKTIGDAFCAVFPTSIAALNAGMEAQTALFEAGLMAEEAEPTRPSLRVRMAIHTGEADARDGDYFGPSLNRTARLLAAGHGGQVLLSGVTHRLVSQELPPSVTLTDLGEHYLRDLRDPEHIWQFCIADLSAAFPPLKTIPQHSHNLPQQLTSFVGREKVIADVKRLLSENRLLTLTGSGGSGKTRLALKVGADIADEPDSPVWLVELASLSDPSLVVQTVAGILGVREEPGRTLLQCLLDSLVPRKLLLILDNCEHLVDTCAQLVAALLRGCPQVRVLATSQEVLGVPGERSLRLPTLSVPDLDKLHSQRSAPLNGEEVVSLLSKYEATQLFLERARTYAPDLEATPQNASALVQICRQLDGIPLAIELAAARVRVMSVEQIALRLSDRFRLLTGGNRMGLPRHQTLTALIDWSYDLLSEPERILLRRLSVFQGGCTLEAVETVCTATLLESWEALDLLFRLVDKSLVVYEERHDGARYRLLETVRAYSAEKLRAAGEIPEVRAQHRLFFSDFADRCNNALLGSEQIVLLNALETEHDNLRAALEWCAEENEARFAVRLTGSLWRFWFFRSYLREGSEQLAKALQQAEEAGLQEERASALTGAGVLAYFQGDAMRAYACCSESQAAARASGDLWLLATSLNLLGIISYHMGDLGQAKAQFEEALEISRQLGDPWSTALSLSDVGFIRMEQGDLEAAQACCEEAVALARSAGEKWGICNALFYLGSVARARGEHARARRHLTEGLTVSQELGQVVVSTWCLEGIGWAWGLEGAAERAARLLGAAEALREGLGAPPSPSTLATYGPNRERVQAMVGEALFEAAWQEGRQLGRSAAFAYAVEEAIVTG